MQYRALRRTCLHFTALVHISLLEYRLSQLEQPLCGAKYNQSEGQNQRISMRIYLDVLSSFDLIITTSMMQSVDESESENEHQRSSVDESVRVCVEVERESRRISMRDLGLEYLRFHHSNKYKYK